MKNLKLFVLSAVMTASLLFSMPSHAKIVMQFAHIFENGCIGTHTYHSTLFGLYTWETYEVVAC